LSDLNDFPKATRETLRATAYEGFDIKCLPPTSGYESENTFYPKCYFLHILLDILTIFVNTYR